MSIMGSPLVLMEMGGSYENLCSSIGILARDKGLPEVIIQCIAKFFIIEPVVSEEVTAIRASSSDKRHALKECLNPSRRTWWISAFGGMPKGVGREYVEFRLSKKPCRFSLFQIEIPPMPSGPLSVKTLQLLCLDTSGEWKVVSPILNIQNQTGFQDFPLNPPVDTTSCRVVCLSNQVSDWMADFDDDDAQALVHYAAVGYYCVKFQ